jgi:microcystin-dependent protein
MSILTGITDNYAVTASENWQSNLDGTITAGANQLTVLSHSAYAVGSWVLWTIDAVDPSTGEPTPSKKEVVYGQVSTANTLVNVVRGIEGSAQSHTNNAVVYDYMTAAHNNIINKRIDAEHKANGTHKDITADSVTTTTLTVTGSGGGLTPTGTISAFAVATAPTGWLLCDGSAVSRSTYSALFNVIGTTYGAGNGTTTFNVPNIKGRVIVGQDSGQTEFDTLGETGGSKTHTLTEAQIPAHSHSAWTDSQGQHGHNLQMEWGTNINLNHSVPGNYNQVSSRNQPYSFPIQQSGLHGHNVGIGNTGGGQAHNILQPYMALPYIIKA